jgi:uncharacterized membrane protein YfcA
MSLLVLLALALVGLAVGFTSGLVGIGGGVLVVPFLYFFYGHSSWSGVSVPAGLHTAAAHATSLLVVVPTAIWGARSYAQAGLVIWKAAIPIAVVSALGAIAGARLALVLPPETVRTAFGVFLLATGMQLLWRPHELSGRPLRLNTFAIVSTGLVSGVLSGLMGIGGGAVAATMLIYLIGLDLKQAAATSLAIVGLAAISGTITYVLSGLGVQGMPAGSVGYVHVLAALPILAGSLISVKLGTLANQSMPEKSLKRVFAAFFTLLGLYLIWQNLPALI